MKILCQGYVSQLLPIFVYSSRAYVFFDFSADFWGMQTGSHEVPVRNDGGASKMYLLLSNRTGG